MMIANISPEPLHTDESISTCSFAQRVALVKNKASINEELEPELVIERLKAEVRRLREELDFVQGKDDNDDDSQDGKKDNELPQKERNELRDSIHQFVHDRNNDSHLDFCGGITLPKIRAVCTIFKDMILSNSCKDIHTNDVDDSDSDSTGEASHIQSPSLQDCTLQTRKEETGHRPKPTPEICGVSVCRDERILDDPGTAFSWFKDRYPSVSSLEESRATLKMKYSEVRI